MTFEDFFKKYPDGTKVDFDGHFGAQCFDLARQWMSEVWDIPQYGKNGVPALVGAKDLWTADLGRWLDRYIAGEKGDLVVFGATKKNPYGHVAVFECYTPEGNLKVKEQDGFAQTGVKTNIWRPSNVLGFLRKKDK